MMRRLLLAAAMTVPALGQAEEVLNFDSSKRSCVAHSDSSWGYYGQLSGRQGDERQQILLPNDWGLRYASCGRSLAPLHRQSPIELPAPGTLAPADPAEVRFEGYGVRRVQVEHNCHTVQATVLEGEKPLPAGLHISGQPYRLLQFHVHTPSEHVIRNSDRGTVNYPGELHFVHAAETADGGIDGSRLAVVGVFVDVVERTANPRVDAFFRNMAKDYAGALTVPSGKGIEVDISKLAPIATRFWRYQGSLTTPPCSETVEWIMLAQPLQMSNETYGLWREKKLNVGFANARPPLLPTGHHQLRFRGD